MFTFNQLDNYTCDITSQVLPYWDWAKLYNEHCLIENPYYTEKELSEEDCQVSCQPTWLYVINAKHTR